MRHRRHRRIGSEPPRPAGGPRAHGADAASIAARTTRAASRCRGVGLGMRRLSIVDLAGGQQPFSNETDDDSARRQRRDLQLSRRLRDELEAHGHAFRSRSDIEVLVHAYEEWGVGFLTRLRGMFALALWDGAHADAARRARSRGREAALLDADAARAAAGVRGQGAAGAPRGDARARSSRRSISS